MDCDDNIEQFADEDEYESSEEMESDDDWIDQDETNGDETVIQSIIFCYKSFMGIKTFLDLPQSGPT